jgi:hypothetical protein
MQLGNGDIERAGSLCFGIELFHWTKWSGHLVVPYPFVRMRGSQRCSILSE